MGDLVHQVWVGPSPVPRGVAGWARLGEHRLWGNEDVHTWSGPLRDRLIYALALSEFEVVANLLRIAVLHEHGGVYIDADVLPLRSIAGAPWLEHDFAAIEGPNGPLNMVLSAAAPGSQATSTLLAAIDKLPMRSAAPAWKVYGSGLLRRTGYGAAGSIPYADFMDRTHDGDRVPGWDATTSYGRHLWATRSRDQQRHVRA